MSTLAADAVRELLDESGLSKAEFSRRAGVSRALLDDYLKGKVQPSVGRLEKLGESVDLRMDITWVSHADEAPVNRTPRWAQPNPAMNPLPLTIDQRARKLERVVATAVIQRRVAPPAEVDAPPYRSLKAAS